MYLFSESINQLKTFLSELPSEYITTVLVSLLIIIAITLIALIVGKKNVDID
jgi:ABC-type transport system involved in cytochrome bd biosynthesis fused ATPase/permease subunit